MYSSRIKRLSTSISQFNADILMDIKFADYGYSDVRQVLNIFQYYASQLLKIDDNLLQFYPRANDLYKILEMFVKILEDINVQFNSPVIDPDETSLYRNNTLELYKMFMEEQSLLPVLLIGNSATDFVALSKEMYHKTSTFATSLEEIYSDAKRKIDDFNRKLTDNNVGKYSTSFGESSTEYAKFSKRWLFASGFFLILSILALIFYNQLFSISADEGTVNLIKYLSTKILVIVLLISSTLWCARMYKVNNNLKVIFLHKSNSLATFTEFVNSAQTREIKDYVLQETTKTIFNLPETGLISSDHLPIQSLSKIVELLKTTKATG